MDAQEFTAHVEDLEKKLERLRALYEQYFTGIERLEPSILRRDVEKTFRQLRKERCHNTAVRFRFQMLIQRHTTLMAHWQKVCRAIEEGTYEPHLQRAKRLLEKQAATGEPVPEPLVARRGRGARGSAIEIDVDLADVQDIDAERAQEAPPATPRPAAGRPPTVPPAGPVTRVRTLDALRALLMDTSELAARVDFPDGSATVPSPPPRRAKAADVAGAGATIEPAMRKLPMGPAGGTPSGPERAPASPRPSLAVRTGPAPALVPVRPPAPRASPAGPPRAAAAPRPPAGEDQARSIHAAFAEAARKASAAVKVPSPEAIRKSLEKETERLQKKHPGQKVDFRVDLKDGKPLIKSFVVPAEKK